MKKTLIICLSIWIVAVAAVLAFQLFDARGILIILCSFFGLALLVFSLDFFVIIKIRKAYKKAAKEDKLPEAYSLFRKIEKMPLTEKERNLVLLNEELCLQWMGQTEKAAAIIDKMPLESLKGSMLTPGIYLRKDYALITGNKDLYEEVSAFQHAKSKEFTPEEKSEELSSRFYFSLLEGFIDPVNEDQAEAIFRSQASLGRIEKLEWQYIVLLEESIRHMPLIGLESFIQDSQGTWLADKGAGLAEKASEDLK